ncbi:hypothetical protein Tco_0317508 [Tanacetum coccineum]
MKNTGKRFVTCSACNVYDFLDDDLPSGYYKELLYGMFQKQKQLKKHLDYEQVIDVLAMDKSVLEEELRAAKSKLKLYDSAKLSETPKCYANAECAKQMQAANGYANACCKCKWTTEMQPAMAKCEANVAAKCKPAMLACK